MPNSIKDYRNLIEQPWGKMFYDQIYSQLNLDNSTGLNILDFGAGFCVTANHYAKYHNVIAVEPNSKMVDLRIQENNYNLINKDIEYIKTLDSNTFDIVICHNVLEYAKNKSKIIEELIRVLKPNGKLSIIKHNLIGKVFSSAVFTDSPQTALQLLNDNFDNSKSSFGNCDAYSNDSLISTCRKNGIRCEEIYGIRTFFALSSNNEIKYTDNWYKNMLELESAVSIIDEYKKVAFYNHLIFTK